MSKSTAERLIKDYKNKKTERYISFGNSDIVKINLKKPLIAQQFELPITNNRLITGGSTKTSKVFTKGVKGIPVRISIFVKFKFKIRKDNKTATHRVGTIIDPSKINDNEYQIINNIKISINGHINLYVNYRSITRLCVINFKTPFT